MTVRIGNGRIVVGPGGAARLPAAGIVAAYVQPAGGGGAPAKVATAALDVLARSDHIRAGTTTLDVLTGSDGSARAGTVALDVLVAS